MWVLDHFEDVVSDLSVFHRVDDWRELPSSRFFQWAERLPAYEGAVRAAFLAARAASATSPPLGPAGEGVSEPPPVDVATLAAISDHPGFPGIEYVRG